MPLMVDQSGHPLYANGPSVSVFAATATMMNGEPLQTAAASAMVATAATVQATAVATSQNLTAEHIKDQQAIQAGLDSELSTRRDGQS